MTLVEIPAGIDAVTPEWSTGAMRCCDTIADSAVVNHVAAERISEDSGFSSLLYRLRISGSAGLPSSLIVKLPAESEAREPWTCWAAIGGNWRSTEPSRATSRR